MSLVTRFRELVEPRTSPTPPPDEIELLRTQVVDARRDARQRRAKIDSLERKIPGREALALLLAAKRGALQQSSRSALALQREAIFESRSAAYAHARQHPMTTGIMQSEFDGLTLVMPAESAEKGTLPGRLMDGELPLADIARVRDLAFGSICIDIGANIGSLALPRVILGDAQLVLAAEPHPLNYACLVRNVVDNGLRGFVLPDHLAISDHDGEAELVESTSMGRHYLSRRGVAANGRQVMTLRLDTWLRRHNIKPADVGFIKCDTQGWEGHVVAGAGEWLRHPHLVWQMEIHPSQLARAGTSAPELLTRLAGVFGHFVDLRGAGRRVRPTSELMDSLDYLLVRNAERYTDILFFAAK